MYVPYIRLALRIPTLRICRLSIRIAYFVCATELVHGYIVLLQLLGDFLIVGVFSLPLLLIHNEEIVVSFGLIWFFNLAEGFTGKSFFDLLGAFILLNVWLLLYGMFIIEFFLDVKVLLLLIGKGVIFLFAVFLADFLLLRLLPGGVLAHC